MADYKRMYSILFNSITDAIDILQKSQQETEEIYISNENNIIDLSLRNTDKENEKGDYDK